MSVSNGVAVTKNPRVVGLSPKAYLPALVGVVVGLVLLILGLVFSDPTLRTIGLTIIGAALGHFGISYAAPVGTVSP